MQVVYGTNGCFNEIVVSQHYIPLLVEYKNDKHYSGLNMIYDQAPCHQTQRVQTNFVNASIRVKRCPKRMTPLFQPADVCWMSPVKSGYFKRWNHWLIHAPKAYTASGNRKSPGYAQVITWISEVWQELDPSLIASSFDKCGITSRNLADYSSQLRHFVRTNMFVVDVVPIDDQISDQITNFKEMNGTRL